MNRSTICLLAAFWTWQVTAQIFFKYGSTTSARWLPCFIAGNVFGASSIWFLMKLYARMNPNLAMALAGGGAFLGVQFALAVVFGSRPSGWQWTGYTMVALGMGMASLRG